MAQPVSPEEEREERFQEAKSGGQATDCEGCLAWVTRLHKAKVRVVEEEFLREY